MASVKASEPLSSSPRIAHIPRRNACNVNSWRWPLRRHGEAAVLGDRPKRLLGSVVARHDRHVASSQSCASSTSWFRSSATALSVKPPACGCMLRRGRALLLSCGARGAPTQPRNLAPCAAAGTVAVGAYLRQAVRAKYNVHVRPPGRPLPPGYSRRTHSAVLEFDTTWLPRPVGPRGERCASGGW